jgi:hypothetical protein
MLGEQEEESLIFLYQVTAYSPKLVIKIIVIDTALVVEKPASKTTMGLCYSKINQG